MVSDLADYSYDMYAALRALGSEPEIEVRRLEELSPRQAAALLEPVVDELARAAVRDHEALHRRRRAGQPGRAGR